jgi:hypothetical protein
MDYSVYDIKKVPDSKIKELLSSKQGFVLENIKRTNMGEAVKRIETMMDNMGLSSRIYQKGRVASMATYAAAPMATGPVGALAAIGVAAGSGAAIAAHNLVTFNPDYEIAKNMVTGTLTITPQKKWKLPFSN